MSNPSQSCAPAIDCPAVNDYEYVLTSDPTQPPGIGGIPVPINLMVPIITGTPQVGNTLSGSNGKWTNSPTGYAYRWLANGTAIVGATANTFHLTSAQVGELITFEVTASNAGGNSLPATSPAVGPVSAAPIVPVHTIVTLVQIWGNGGQLYGVTDLIQRTSTDTPVNTAAAFFDAAHTQIWIPVSYVPNWSVGTHVYWGHANYTMRVAALGAGQIQFNQPTDSGVTPAYFGEGPNNYIATTTVWSMTTVVTADANWTTPGVGSSVQVSASAVTGGVGDVVWVGGFNVNQFQIVSIVTS